MQGRGLKLRDGADGRSEDRVAPHAGAWIETLNLCLNAVALQSPLMQGRGLKQDLCAPARLRRRRSPLMQGRGLKPLIVTWTKGANQSPLMQGRGLKRQFKLDQDYPRMSPLMQGRGLKRQTGCCGSAAPAVAPHAGAWIETRPSLLPPRSPESPLMQGRGLKLVRGGRRRR